MIADIARLAILNKCEILQILSLENMFYNMFFTTFALAFGKQPSRALDGKSKEMLKMATKQKIFSKNFGNSKNGCTFAKFSARKNARARKRTNIERLTIDKK